MTTDTRTAIQRAASAGYDAMENATRTGSDERYVRTKDDAPEWVENAIKDAHGSGTSLLLPDDWTYERCRNAFEAISEADSPEDARHEWADAEVDTYNSGLFAWLASYPGAASVCDEAADEFGGAADSTTIDRIGWGQYLAASRIYDAILAACEAQADEEE